MTRQTLKSRINDARHLAAAVGARRVQLELDRAAAALGIHYESAYCPEEVALHAHDAAIAADSFLEGVRSVSAVCLPHASPVEALATRCMTLWYDALGLPESEAA